MVVLMPHVISITLYRYSTWCILKLWRNHSIYCRYTVHKIYLTKYCLYHYTYTTLSCLAATNQSIHSGNSPTLKDGSTGGDLIYKFSKLMLRRHKNLRKDMRSCIVASLLRYWSKIESLIQGELSGKFTGKRGETTSFCWWYSDMLRFFEHFRICTSILDEIY